MKHLDCPLSEEMRVEMIPEYELGRKRFTNHDKAVAALQLKVAERVYHRKLKRLGIGEFDGDRLDWRVGTMEKLLERAEHWIKEWPLS